MMYRLNTRICASKLFLVGVQFFLTGSVYTWVLMVISLQKAAV